MSTDRQAQRIVYWRGLMELLAERALRQMNGEWVRPEWDAMERRRLRECWRQWREACEAEAQTEQREAA